MLENEGRKEPSNYFWNDESEKFVSKLTGNSVLLVKGQHVSERVGITNSVKPVIS